MILQLYSQVKDLLGNVIVKRINILSQTYNATLVLLGYYYGHADALSKLFHLINSSFSQASNHSLVLTILLKLILLMKVGKKKMKCMVMY